MFSMIPLTLLFFFWFGDKYQQDVPQKNAV